MYKLFVNLNLHFEHSKTTFCCLHNDLILFAATQQTYSKSLIAFCLHSQPLTKHCFVLWCSSKHWKEPDVRLINLKVYWLELLALARGVDESVVAAHSTAYTHYVAVLVPSIAVCLWKKSRSTAFQFVFFSRSKQSHKSKKKEKIFWKIYFVFRIEKK